MRRAILLALLLAGCQTTEDRLAAERIRRLPRSPTRRQAINPKIRNEAGALVRSYPLESRGAA